MKRKFTFLLMALLALTGFKSWGQETLPYSYGFENNDLAAAGWTTVNYSSENASEFGIFNNAKHDGNYGFQFSSYTWSSNYNQYLISPQISASSEFVFQFYYARRDQYGSETFRVGYSTTDNQPNSFTYGDDIYANSQSWTLSEEFHFPATTKYVAIHYHSDYQYRLYVDDFTFTAPNSCPKPTDLTASNITATGATISWTGNGAESYDLAYGVASTFDLNNSATYTLRSGLTATSVQLTGLTNGTEYKCAVKAVCGAGEESDWSQYSFTPTCPTIAYLYSGGETAATVTLYWGVNGSTDSYTLAYGDSESFDIDNPNTYEIVDGINTTTYQLQDLTTGTYKYAVKASCGGSEYGDWSNTMTFTLSCPAPSLNSYNIDFTLTTATISWNSYQNFIESYTLAYGLAETFDLENPSTYASVNVVPDEYGYASYTIQNLTTNVSYKCAARSSCDGSTQSAWSNVVTFTPSLKAPNNLSVSNIKATSATASWQASEGAANYTVAYGLTSAFNLNDPATYQTTTPTSATSVVITGLTAEQYYACAVKATTLNDINSEWSNPVYFTPTAKQTLVANNGTSTSIDGFDGAPFNGYNVENTNVQGQFIIPASELTAMSGSSIIELEFYHNNSYAWYSSYGAWNIYLKEVSNTAVPSSFYNTDSDPDMELVYSGSIDIPNTVLSVTLNTPFEYNGSNLLVCFKETSTAGATNSWTPWLGVYTSEYTSIGYDNNYGNVVRNQFLPKTTITYIPGATRYDVICDNSIEHGSISANPSNAAAGTVIELTATPENGYGLSAWTVTNVTTSETITVTNNQFTMPESDVNVTATFVVAQKYTITCNNPAVGGTIHAEYGGVTINEASEGTTITLVAVPSTGCSLNYFTVDGAQIGGNTFTMPAHNVTVSAVFALEPQDLTVNDGAATNQTIPTTTAQTWYSTKSQFIIPFEQLQNMYDGTITDMTFYADFNNFDFGAARWNVYVKEVDYQTLNDYVSTEGMTLVYNGGMTIANGQMHIEFTNDYEYSDNNLLIYFEQIQAGNCTNDWESWYGVNTSKATAYAGYDYGSGQWENSHYPQWFLPKTTFRYMPSANPPARYTITVNQTEGGSISASKTSVTEGTLISLTATPDYGYEFVEWNITPNVEITDNQFTMPGSNVTVSATFTTKQGHTVTITNPTDNAHTTAVLTATPNTEVIADDEVRLSYSNLAEGYKFVNYVATNASTSESIAIQQGWDNGSYSYFIMPNANVNLTANVKLIRTINVAEMQHGNLYLDPDPQHQQIAAGETITISPTPDYGYELGTLTITKVSGGTITPEQQEQWGQIIYTFVMPEDDVNISATFVATGILYTVTLPEETEIGRVSAQNTDTWESGTEYFENDNVRLYVYVKDSHHHIGSVVVKKDSNQEVVDFSEQSGNYYYFVMPADDVTVTATFEEDPRYLVSIVAANGTVNLIDAPTGNSYYNGQQVKFNVTPDAGYVMDDVTCEPSTSIFYDSYWGYYYFTMPEAPVTINASFVVGITIHDGTAENQYIPFLGNYTDNTLTKSQFIFPAAELTAISGSNITDLTFYTNNSVNKTFGALTWDVFMKEVDYITPGSSFINWTDMTSVYHGTITISDDKLKIHLSTPFEYNGGNLMIGFRQNEKANGIYQWTQWVGDNNEDVYHSVATDESENPAQSYFLPKTTIIYEHVEKYDITLTQPATEVGTIQALANGVVVTQASAGTEITLQYNFNPGYQFTNWIVNGNPIQGNTFTMPATAVTVSVNYNALTPHNITCTPTIGGTLHAEYNSETITAAFAGTEITLVAEPNTGYIFDHFIVGGTPIDGSTFTMPDSEVTVSAEFVSAVTVYDNGGTTDSQYWPLCPYEASYSYIKSNMIMPAADLDEMVGGTINSMKFYVKSFSPELYYQCYSTWQVYLKEVSENETTGPVDVTTATKVFEGVIDFKVSEITINFTEPFEYNGGNLLIATQNIDKTGFDEVYFYGENNSYGYTSSGTGKSSSSLNDVTSWSSTSSFLPKTTFFYTPGETRYNITVISVPDGCTATASKKKAVAGETITLSATPKPYFYTFGTWSVVDAGGNTVELTSDAGLPENSFIMPEGDVTVTANFNSNTLYSINITSCAEADILAKYNGENIVSAPEGITIDLSYENLQEGYAFEGWTVKKDGKIPVDVTNNQFVMPNRPVSVTAIFSAKVPHIVTINNPENGTVSVSANEEPISTGEAVYPETTLTFGNTPAKNSYNNDLSKFNHYVVTEEGQQAQHLGTGVNTYTMPNCNLTVSAVFDPLYFPTLSVTGYSATVALWAGPNNMDTRQVGGQYNPGVAAGEYVFINAEDLDGYRKTITWSDSQGQHETIAYSGDNRPCFVMPADNNVTVSVQYAVIQKYNIALNYNTEGGSITVSQSEQVAGGTLVHIYINTTNLHFSFNASALSVTYNGGLSSVEVTTVTEGSHYQFSMPEGNVTVYAEYTEDENYAVNIVKPEGCDFNVTYQSNGQNPTTSNVYCGYKVYLNDLAISSGYHFDGWNVTYKNDENDIPVEIVEEYGLTYFVMPQGPVTITANVHELIAHTITVVQTTGGTITVNHSSAILGTEIYWNVTDIDEGFVHDGWIVTGSETTKYDSSVPGIVMPDENISVEAVFLKESIVNDGSSTNNSIPINCFLATYYNTRSQFIINSNDLQDMYDASITDMTFFIQSTSSYSYTATWDVYLKEVDETEFASDAYVDVTEMTKVYTGTMTIANYKMKIHFDAPFTYTDKNLMVSFVQTTNSDDTDPYISDAWYGVYTQNYHVAYGTSSWETSSSTNFLPKTKFSYKPSETPTTRYEIAINNPEGTTITASREVASAGTVITLTQETSSDYDFNDWNVTYSGGTVTVDENDQFVMPAANVTVSANVTPKPHYTITLDTDMTNGTLTLSPQSEIGYMEGVTVSISTNPETGYKFDEDYGVKAWKAGDPMTEVEVTTGYSGYNITMPAYNIVISARFIPLTGYTITYHVNGVETQETVYENERIQPSDPIVAGTSFVGWGTSDIATYSETEPTLFETGDYPTSDVELYAVFRYTDQSKWAPVYDESSLSTTGSDRVIFAYYDSYSGGDPRIMTYYDSWHFESATGEMNSTSEIVSIPANTTIFRPEKTEGSWKFYFNYDSSETTLADYNGSNLYPLSIYSDGTDTWNFSYGGYVYDNNDYIGLRNNNTFNINNSNQARLYKEVKPEVTLDAYFTEVLSISGNEILNGNMTTRNLLINRGANYTVNDNITLTVTGFAKNVENIAANFVFKNGAEFHYNNNDGTVSATFEKNIVGYNDPDAIGDGWYFIANPTANTTVNLSGGYSYDLYTFNPAAAAEWHNEQYDNNIQIPENEIAISRETGYLYANSNNHTLRFEGGLLTSETEKVINLVYAEAGPGIDFPGFNLIGNPFPCTAYSDFDIYKLVDGSEVQISEDGTVDPCEAFFVEAKEVGETVTLSTTAPGKSYAMPIVVNSNRGETLDRAILHLEGTRDSHKFMMNPDRTNISFTKNGEKFAAVSRGDETEIPMNFTADHKGSYTISVNTENFEEEYLHLIDVVSGDDIDLLVTPNYTFEADADEYASRFRIVFGTTDINDDPATSSEPFVYISNGNLVINNIEGTASMQIIDMLGRIVRTETVSGSYNKPHNLKAGAYVITLDGRAQRIVIE